MDPQANADYAAGMISSLLKRYGGNVPDALSAYNSGSPRATGTKTRWADGSDLGYADSVLRHYHLLTAESPQSSATAESSAEIASVGALATQAQRLPLLAPHPPTPLTAPAHGPRSYHRQTTDYLALLNDDPDDKHS